MSRVFSLTVGAAFVAVTVMLCLAGLAEALAEALNSGTIAGAGLDVLTLEPPRADNPLLGAKNCFITPHFAWATTAARARLMAEVTENVLAFLEGKRRNVLNG